MSEESFFKDTEAAKHYLKIRAAHLSPIERKIYNYPSGNLPCQGWEGPCENNTASLQRQNTAYHDDERNWVTLCPECMKACDEYWAEMWEEYYNGY